MIRTLASRAWFGLMLVGAGLVAGCGHSNQNNGYGNAFVSYSATHGNFSSYTVIVTSITLTRTDSAVVTGVSAAETVDFAKLSDTAEMVSNTSVPIGTYKSATINLNYTGGLAYVDVNGQPQQATIVDATGAALTTLAVVVSFDPSNPLVIAQSQAQRLNIDFDLAASNRIDFSTSPATVIATPFLTVSNSPADPKPIRVRGPLISYDTELATYTVYVRPFNDQANNLGALTLFTTPTTAFAIDNQNFVGSAGVTTLSNITTGTLTAANTIFAADAKAGTFTPSQVYVASALESLIEDRIQGSVVARSGNSVTVQGATYLNRDGTVTYEALPTILLLGSGTYFGIDGQPTATPALASVSIGQEITALGQAAVATSGALTLDATAGHVRLGATRVWGNVTAGAAGSATLNLQAIGFWPVTSFDFAGTGLTAAQDAVPTAYAVNAGALDETAAIGTAVAADGLINAFGSAPPDFTANAITPIAGAKAQLEIEWLAGGTTTPFVALSNTSAIPKLTGATLGAHVITVGPYSTDLTTLAASPTIVPNTAQKSEFSTGSAAAGVSVASDFGSFMTNVNAALLAAKPVARLVANGVYDAASNTFTATTVNVVLQ